MDFDLNDNQAAIVDAFVRGVDAFRQLPTGTASECVQSAALDALIDEGGFLQLASLDDYGPLEAALIVLEAAKLPYASEVAASALIAPLLGEHTLPRPIAVSDNRYGPIRYLPGARSLILLEHGQAHVATLEPDDVEPLHSVLAYPFGKLTSPDALTLRSLGPAGAEKLLTGWRISLALEAAGLTQAAFELTREHVSQRQQFGRAIGSFQAIQHRLANAIQLIHGGQWLALRAAQSADPLEAALAATYTQTHLRTVIMDLHQFNGTLGLTLEYPLHLWTYRLKALQGELGGVVAQAEAACAVFDTPTG